MRDNKNAQDDMFDTLNNAGLGLDIARATISTGKALSTGHGYPEAAYSVARFLGKVTGLSKQSAQDKFSQMAQIVNKAGLKP